MVRTFFSLLILFLALVSCKQDNYRITGRIGGLDEGKVYLLKAETRELVRVDSTEISGGDFTFTGSVDFPGVYAIEAEGAERNLIFFLENSEINITADADAMENGQVTGSSVHDKFVEFTFKESEYDDRISEIAAELTSLREEGDQEAFTKLMEDEYQPLLDEKRVFIKDFVTANPSSYVSPFILYNKLWMSLDVQDKDNMLSVLEQELERSPFTKTMKDELETLMRVDVGQRFVDFTMDDPDGNSRSLSAFTGEGYLLLDFTASWCGPCRSINPAKVELYHDFRDQGFDIVSISLDRSYDEWVKYIEEDNLEWHHLSDLQAWNSEAAGIYGVRAIPHSVLIDPDGIIVEKGLRPDALRERLNELLQ